MMIHHDLYQQLSGSSVETKQKQSVELLQLLVYTAAQTNAQRFIEMVFSTSAGQVVFNYYKDRTPLPEDVARANGYDKLAQYLQDLHTRYCGSSLCVLRLGTRKRTIYNIILFKVDQYLCSVLKNQIVAIFRRYIREGA